MSKDKKQEVNREGLKRRRVNANDAVVKKPLSIRMVKPRKMKQKADFGSAGTLVFPTDKAGLTVDLKKAMLNIATRIGNDSKNMDILVNTLKVLMEHIEYRAKQNVEVGVRTLRKRSDVIAEAQAKPQEEEQEVAKDPVKKPVKKTTNKKGKK